MKQPIVMTFPVADSHAARLHCRDAYTRRCLKTPLQRSFNVNTSNKPSARRHSAAIPSSARVTRAKRAPSSETREGLVTAAIACISEVGYSNATTPLIAERAGVSRGALQYHFESREDLIIAVIDEVASELNFTIDAESLKAASLEARIHAVIDAYWLVFSGQKFIAALNIWLSIGADPALGDRLGAHMQQVRRRTAATWRELFADTHHTQPQLTSIRRMIMSTVRGYAVLRILDQEDQWKRDRAMVIRLMVAAMNDHPSADSEAVTARGTAGC